MFNYGSFRRINVMFQKRTEFLINQKIKDYVRKLLPLLFLLIVFGLMLNEEQNRKEALHTLFTDAQANHIEKNAWFYTHLKDIDCSLPDVPLSEKEELLMYLQVYKESISNYINEDYISEKTKRKLKDALEYTPCECD